MMGHESKLATVGNLDCSEGHPCSILEHMGQQMLDKILAYSRVHLRVLLGDESRT